MIQNRFRTAVAAAIGLLLPLVAAAAEPRVPREVELPEAPVRLAVDSADITVAFDPEAAPLLRWVEAEPDRPGLAELAPSSVDGMVLVERAPAPDGAVVSRSAIQLVVPPATGLAVQGDDVELVIEHRVGEPAEPGRPAPALELELTRSRARISRVGNLVGSLDDCLTSTDQTTGALDLAVSGGDLQVAGHQGTLKVTGHGASVAAEGCRGAIHAELAGGSMLLDNVHGSFNVTGTDAQVELVRSQGNGTVTGANATVDVRDCRINRLNLKAESSYLTLSQTTATTTVDLSGGSLTADDAGGTLSGTARDSAGIAVNAHAGDVNLNLATGARADLRDIDGHVSATVNRAELEIVGARSLALRADDGRASAAAIGELRKFNAQRSRIELDLTDADATDFTFQVRDESSLRLDVATPCRVRVTGVDATLASQVRVLGCELQFGQGRRWATRRVRGVDGNLPTTLTVTMTDSAELHVEGR